MKQQNVTEDVLAKNNEQKAETAQQSREMAVRPKY